MIVFTIVTSHHMRVGIVLLISMRHQIITLMGEMILPSHEGGVE